MTTDDTEDDVMPPEPKQVLSRRGRLPGFKNKFSKDSVKKLAALGFDPIEKLVECHKSIASEIQRQQKLQKEKDEKELITGKMCKNGYSAMAHTALLVAEQKLLNDLVPYRYSKVPVEVKVDDNSLPPIMISLTKQGDVYSIDPSENIDINDVEKLNYGNDDE